MKSLHRGLAACAAALALSSLAAGAADAAVHVHFLPGTYYLAHDKSGDPPVDQLDVSISGGVASFVLTGADNATWSLADGLTPDLAEAQDVRFSTSQLISYSWPFIYNELWFYTDKDGGGLQVNFESGPAPYLNLYTSDRGPGVVYTTSAVAEPAAWAMMIAGFLGLGGLLRRQRDQALA